MSLAVGQKPTWAGLKSGGDKTPVKEVIGTVNPQQAYTIEPDDFGATNIGLNFVQCQIIRTDNSVPYPYAEVQVLSKYSDRQNSVWGKLGTSIALCLGITLDQLDIDSLAGRQFHMVCTDNFLFFKGRDGVEARGSIWTAYNVGQAPAPEAQAAPMAPTPVVPAAPVVPQPVVPQVPAASPAAMALDPGRAKALALLNGPPGLTLSEFFTAALGDDAIKGDGALVSEIVDRVFMANMVAAGLTVEGADGRFSAP